MPTADQVSAESEATPREQAAITDAELGEFLRVWKIVSEDWAIEQAVNLAPRLVERVREQDAIIAELTTAKQELARAMIEVVKAAAPDSLRAIDALKAVAKANGVVIE